MKNAILILLLAIPLWGLSQDIGGTGWKITSDDGGKIIILFKLDNTFIYLNVISPSGNESEVYGDHDETWKVDGNKIVILFSDGYQILSGTINTSGNYMSGTSINKKGDTNKWSGELIKF